MKAGLAPFLIPLYTAQLLGSFQDHMQQKANNYAFIDGQNLYLAIQHLGWKLDYKGFRVYLAEKYSVRKAYMFMGFLPTNQKLYNFLQTVGFVLIFKPILELKEGKVKGNVDAELVLQVMIDYQQYDQAVLVTGDGDFYCLVKYLDEQRKLARVLAPSSRSCSALLKKVARNTLGFVSDLRHKLEYKKKSTP